MKIISWNVNGLRASIRKGFLDYLIEENPDIIGIQETKLQEKQVPEELDRELSKVDPDFEKRKVLDNYNIYWNYADKKGYSGVALFSKDNPISVSYNLGDPDLDNEGRLITADYGPFILMNVYFPNGQMNDERLDFKLRFYDKTFEVMQDYRGSGKNVIVCGDFNTAHKEIDLKNPKQNEKTSGFLPVERKWLDKLVDNGYIDTFRHFDQRPDQYTWWTYRFNAREKNVGWRIDYFFINKEFLPFLEDAFIRQDVYGSDHCPLGIATSR